MTVQKTFEVCAKTSVKKMKSEMSRANVPDENELNNKDDTDTNHNNNTAYRNLMLTVGQARCCVRTHHLFHVILTVML